MKLNLGRKEVIAKLEELGGTNKYNLSGECKNAIYFINGQKIITNSGVLNLNNNAEISITALMWAGTEIFLDEPVEEQKPVNTLKTYDPVMCSDDGKEWYIALYKNGFSVFNDIDGNGFATCKYKYIVPHSDFDFNDLESNIKRSVV